MENLSRWAAKYPFDEWAHEYLRNVALDIDEYFSDDLIHIVNYAYKRALGKETRVMWDNDDIEAISYYLSVLIVRGTENRFIYHHFADKESKRAYKLLLTEVNYNIVKLAKNLNLPMKLVNNSFAIPFLQYIRISSRFSNPTWKPYYTIVENGLVHISKVRVCRILAEEIREKIMEDIEKITLVPDKILTYSEKLLNELKEVLERQKQSIQITEDIRSRDWSLYPPCIKWIINNIPSGVPHIARFTLVTFLGKMGYSVEEIINIFSRVPDFNEDRTRYQVEHIMGLRGGRKVYEVPSCSTLKSYNLCFPDEICINIKHPLAYVYKKKTYKLKK
mgnify:CR=1 FL=1